MVDNCIFLSQKVRIMPNASQRKIIDDLIARARFIHNFAIKRFNDVIEKTGEVLNSDNLRNYYLAHRNEYEFLKGTFSTLENQVFKDIQKKIKINIYTLKKKKLNFKSVNNGGQSFYLSLKEFNIKEFPYKKHHYLQFDTLPSPIKIQNKMRFPTGIPLSVVIKKEYDKYYAGITFKLKREDYINSLTYKVEDTNKAIGIDLGAKQYITTSCGLNIECDRPLSKLLKREEFLNRALNRKVHPLCKGDTTPKSKNYIKYSKKLGKLHKKIHNIRQDNLNKISTFLVKNFGAICMEDLELQDLVKKKSFARLSHDLSFAELKNKIQYKGNFLGRTVVIADRFFPSSKRCVKCGHINSELKITDRIYRCEKCGFEIDRDFNAACNLFKYMKNITGWGTSKLTVDEINKLKADCEKYKIIHNFQPSVSNIKIPKTISEPSVQLDLTA